MAYEYTDRVFLGTIPGLTRGTHPLNDPPGPGNNAGVRQNLHQVDRAGLVEAWRFAKIEAVAEFAASGQECTAVGYSSRVNPATTDLSPETDGSDEWMTREGQICKSRDSADEAAGNVLRFTVAGTKWFTIRVVSGDVPTQWRVYGITERQGGAALAIG